MGDHHNDKTLNIQKVLQEEGERERQHLEQRHQALDSKVAQQGDHLKHEMKEIKKSTFSTFSIAK